MAEENKKHRKQKYRGIVKKRMEEKIRLEEEQKKQEEKRKREEEEKRQKEFVEKIKKHKGSKAYIAVPIIAGLVSGAAYFLIARKIITSLIIGISILLIISLYIFIRKKLERIVSVRKMEYVFPDFIELMASNLRAGMTIDKALLLSSRKEFHPLDDQIMVLGKDIITGREISTALIEMSNRIGSHKIKKTITVIISGIRSGGNLAVLLEEATLNMRERNFVEKRAASNVLMYLIFIFFAVSIGAPALFALSSVLVEVLSSLLGDLPAIDASVNIPITLTSINVSTTFIIYFSVVFIIVINIIASLLLGLVNRGQEKEGTKYIIPLSILSLGVFFTMRFFLKSYLSSLF